MIILTTAYSGIIRYSICDNIDCDNRTFPTKPFLDRLHINHIKNLSENA